MPALICYLIPRCPRWKDSTPLRRCLALLICDLRAVAGCSPLLLFCDDNPQLVLVTHYLHFIRLVVIQQLERTGYICGRGFPAVNPEC